jgi:lipopolysaccharide/colanic/teichoic acid biosynthesis glycosyltransferase
VNSARAVVDAGTTGRRELTGCRYRPGESALTMAATVIAGAVAAASVIVVGWNDSASNPSMVVLLAVWAGCIGGGAALVFRLFEVATWRRPVVAAYALSAAMATVLLLVGVPVSMVVPQSGRVVGGWFAGAIAVLAFVGFVLHRPSPAGGVEVDGRVALEKAERNVSGLCAAVPVSSVQQVLRRAIDVTGALVLLLLTLPVVAAVTLAVKATSSGPVLYGQDRVGVGGQVFRFRKFRTMVADAEADGVARWAEADDPRVTPVGRLLRRSRVDELPQLLDVLAGRMSLVGPRPERPEFVEELRRQLPAYDVRHLVKPGLTGWAQVRYRYAASVDETARKLEYDLFYVTHRSLLFDLKILADTVPVVLFGTGAQ